LLAGVGQGERPSQEAMTVVWQLRLPRAVAGALVGAALACSGTAFQGVFRNPLVSSGILGVSNGAGFGACLAIVFFPGGYFIYGFAFLFGVLAVTLSYFAGRIYGTTPTVTLILGGVIVSSFFGALTSILKYVADPYTQLPAIVFWFMGSLASIGYKHFAAFIPMLVGMGAIYLARWKINVLSMGEKEALALGVNTKFYKILIIGGATLATASAVCISGVIGWVGLVIPHIGRMLVGNNNTKLVPVSMSLGACFLVLIDMLARVISNSEIPIGILTALIGTPFFVYLLKKTKGGGWT
jgi:ABC-type Fe3+-siderophore transport system, permease component